MEGCRLSQVSLELSWTLSRLVTRNKVLRHLMWKAVDCPKSRWHRARMVELLLCRLWALRQSSFLYSSRHCIRTYLQLLVSDRWRWCGGLFWEKLGLIDCETEVFTGFSAQVHAVLHFWLCTSVLWKIICKDCVFMHFCLCLQPPRNKEVLHRYDAEIRHRWYRHGRRQSAWQRTSCWIE